MSYSIIEWIKFQFTHKHDWYPHHQIGNIYVDHCRGCNQRRSYRY